jgi:hypothetical protein
MFAIAGIVVSLAYIELAARALVAPLPVPFAPTAMALVVYGFAVDVRLRRSELLASPLLGWALLLAAYAAIRYALSPAPTWPAAFERALPIVLFLAISQGVQRFAALGAVAAALLFFDDAAAIARLHAAPLDHLVTVAAATPLAIAYLSRNRTIGAACLLLLTLGVLVVCVIVTRTQPLRFTYDLRNGFEWPTLLLGAVMLWAALSIPRAVRRAYADEADAAVARSWARALRPSLIVVAAAFFVAPAAAARLFWIYTGLAGALYQAARAHDPSFRLRAYDKKG